MAQQVSMRTTGISAAVTLTASALGGCLFQQCSHASEPAVTALRSREAIPSSQNSDLMLNIKKMPFSTEESREEAQQELKRIVSKEQEQNWSAYPAILQDIAKEFTRKSLAAGWSDERSVLSFRSLPTKQSSYETISIFREILIEDVEPYPAILVRTVELTFLNNEPSNPGKAVFFARIHTQEISPGSLREVCESNKDSNRLDMAIGASRDTMLHEVEVEYSVTGALLRLDARRFESQGYYINQPLTSEQRESVNEVSWRWRYTKKTWSMNRAYTLDSGENIIWIPKERESFDPLSEPLLYPFLPADVNPHD